MPDSCQRKESMLMRKLKQLISLFIVLTLFFNGTFVFATQPSLDEEPHIERVKEIKPLRQTNSETYLMSDGSYECIIYSGNKYYEDNANDLQLIDNTITTAIPSSSNSGIYKNTANAFDTYFSKSGTPEVNIQYDGDSITFSPINTALETPNRIDSTDPIAVIGAVDNCAILSTLTSTGNNTITYSNAFAATDLVYVLENQQLKEYIILNNSDAPNTFNFLFNLNGLSLQTIGGVLCFTSPDGTPIFSLSSLFAVDSCGSFTEAVSYTYTQIKNTEEYIITITLAEEYLTSPDRIYPIVIDPSIIISDSTTPDSFVSSTNPDTNYYMDAYLRTGFDATYGIRRGYIKFDIPSSVPSTVISATLDLERVSGATPTVSAFRSLSDWSSSTITWNNKPFYSIYHASTTTTLRSGSDNWYTMDVTGIVQDWQTGRYYNFGFVLVDSCEDNYDQWTTFYSSEVSSPHRPELHILYTYTDPIEIDRYNTFYYTTFNYREQMVNKMNCYGYALHIYSLEGDALDNYRYRQQPGEFAQDGKSYSTLLQEYDSIFYNTSFSGTQALNYIESAMFADFATFADIYGRGEWRITSTTASAAVPDGYQKIALTVGYQRGYHFYLRHSDGDWSHKPGTTSVTNRSFDTKLIITDSNITQVATEGGYTSGVRYYLIKKPAIIDYPHENGHNLSASYTVTHFSAGAGDSLKTSLTIQGSSLDGRFDYSGDIDNFYYTTPNAGTFSFLVAPKIAGTNMHLFIYDTYGNIVSYYDGTPVPVVTVRLPSDMRYFIQVYDNNETLAEYTLSITYRGE